MVIHTRFHVFFNESNDAFFYFVDYDKLFTL